MVSLNVLKETPAEPMITFIDLGGKPGTADCQEEITQPVQVLDLSRLHPDEINVKVLYLAGKVKLPKVVQIVDWPCW